MTYTVLDVRERTRITQSHFSKEAYGSSGSINIEERAEVVVIAEDEAGTRKRFTFYPPRKEEFLGEMSYYGHLGDYGVFVPGDKFEVEETSTWTNVKLIKEITIHNED